MAGRGMGAATKGGGCVSSGARNKMTSKPSSKVAVMMKDGGMAKKKDKDVSMPMARGIAMAMEAGKKLVGKKDMSTPAEREFLRDVASGKVKGNLPPKAKVAMKKIKQAGSKKKKPVKKMGGGMMKKYRKGGYAGCK